LFASGCLKVAACFFVYRRQIILQLLIGLAGQNTGIALKITGRNHCFGHTIAAIRTGFIRF